VTRDAQRARNDMAISLPKPPPAFDQVVARAVGSTSAAGHLKMAAMGGAGAAVQQSAPHRLFSVELQDLAQGKGIDAARPVGWRTFLVDGQSVVGLAEVAERGGALANEASVFEGALVERSSEAIEAADQSGAGAADPYELRILQVPALHVLAAWLHGPKDLFVPVMGPNLTSRKIYPSGDFFAAIQAAARDLLKQAGADGSARV
jgi:hypothetical protein